MLLPFLAVLFCLVIAWAIIGKLPATPPVPKWAWYALTGVIAIVLLLTIVGIVHL